MAQVPPEFQLLRRISRVNAATGRQRCHHLSAAIYPARPSSTAPVAEHTAYIITYQQADEARDVQFPYGEPALNHKPTDAELKTIFLDALAASTLRSYYQTLHQQYCNRSSTAKTYQDLYNDIHDLVK